VRLPPPASINAGTVASTAADTNADTNAAAPARRMRCAWHAGNPISDS